LLSPMYESLIPAILNEICGSSFAMSHAANTCPASWQSTADINDSGSPEQKMRTAKIISAAKLQAYPA